MDARMPQLTRHKEIERKIKQADKKILYVLNKCDLIRKEEADILKRGFDPCVFVSSKKKLGGTLLFNKIMMMSGGKPCKVGALGYPNVGKSSVINLLKGKGSASVSSHAGHTTGVQFIKAKNKIFLLDTPGVLPFQEKDELKQLMIGAINPQKVSEPEYYAMKLIEEYPILFENYLDVKFEKDPVDFLEKVAMKKNYLKKGGTPDIERLSVQLLQDWQIGKLHQTS
ncbi:MAG: GTPase [archaeon]